MPFESFILESHSASNSPEQATSTSPPPMINTALFGHLTPTSPSCCSDQNESCDRTASCVLGSAELGPEYPTPPRKKSDANPNALKLDEKKASLYKTELCRSWEDTGACKYGIKCQFAHSENELRIIDRHPKYKTEMCKTFW